MVGVIFAQAIRVPRRRRIDIVVCRVAVFRGRVVGVPTVQTLRTIAVISDTIVVVTRPCAVIPVVIVCTVVRFVIGFVVAIVAEVPFAVVPVIEVYIVIRPNHA